MMELRFIERGYQTEQTGKNFYITKTIKILQQKIDGVWVDIPCVSEENA